MSTFMQDFIKYDNLRIEGEKENWIRDCIEKHGLTEIEAKECELLGQRLGTSDSHSLIYRGNLIGTFMYGLFGLETHAEVLPLGGVPFDPKTHLQGSFY